LSAAPAAPSRRPLFLGPALRARVDLDGPALRVRAEERAETRYPLCRVSRVMAGVRVSWSAEALRACLESSIPIVIVAANGVPLGSIQPARVRVSRLAEGLNELLDWPGWREVYAAWLRAARMRVMEDWRRSREAAGAPPEAGMYRQLVRRHLYGGEREAAADGPELWRGAVYALAAGLLERWQAPALVWGSGGDVLDFRRDLAALLELRLRLEVSPQMGAAVKGEAAMLLVLHALTGKLEREAGRAIRSLARRINEVLAEWR
jgi:hypothetical protein